MSSVKKDCKIVLFNDSLSGGAGTSMLTLAEALQKSGIEVHLVICENKIDFEIPASLSFHLLNSDVNTTYSKKAYSRKLREKLKVLGESDMVMSNSSPSNRILSYLALSNAYHCVRSAETKTFSGFFQGIRAAWRNYKYRKLYTDKRLITVSKGLKKIIIEQIKAKPKSIQTIYEPFDFPHIAELAEEKNTAIPKEPYLIHVGRFDLSSKRQDILLKAYKKANIQYPIVLLGDGEDKEKITAYIKELGLEGRIIMPGFSANPFPWIKQAKLFVFSSDFEGFGRVLVEALALKTPVVSTNCPTGPSEILTDTLSSYLVPIQDADMIADKMKEALLEYPPIPDTAVEKFQADHIVWQYMKLMEGKQ
ncbi:Alpha-1,4-N-acetylgalactosamine transferase PglJ [hydrothermal vent metagenome]|uniref:Alpha-1,4-N-acetylgalactosamine transferase PglJ n=1 Tax=hydrothermal vent metagenome TaxID=652676 RepID=A0A1W1CNJ6_9ZZZZ